jgi:hypothetical protein
MKHASSLVILLIIPWLLVSARVVCRTTELSAEFFYFRGVGNTILPFRVVNYGSGQKIAQTIITSDELYQDLPDALIEP